MSNVGEKSIEFYREILDLCKTLKLKGYVVSRLEADFDSFRCWSVDVREDHTCNTIVTRGQDTTDFYWNASDKILEIKQRAQTPDEQGFYGLQVEQLELNPAEDPVEYLLERLPVAPRIAGEASKWSIEFYEQLISVCAQASVNGYVVSRIEANYQHFGYWSMTVRVPLDQGLISFYWEARDGELEIKARPRAPNSKGHFGLQIVEQRKFDTSRGEDPIAYVETYLKSHSAGKP